MLLYGAWLRRSRRPSQARAYLIRAEESFAAVGAVPWLDRARAELRASGQPRSIARAAEPVLITPPLQAEPPRRAPDAAAVPNAQSAADGGTRRQDHDPIDDLTAQERLVVELAAEGLSNRQIGERLFLSPRTVGSHLYKAFPKLGVSNRAQLRAALDSTRGVRR
jgi:DNA-binding CsgD family transcriptional regulator